MPIRKYNPTSPGSGSRPSRPSTRSRRPSRTSRWSSRCSSTGGRNNQGELTSWWRGGGHKRMLPHHRLQARQARHSGEGRDDRVRPEPLGADRAADLCRRREALHPAAGRPEGRRHDRRRRRTSTSCRATRCRCKNIPLGTLLHNVELQAGQGRPDRAQRRIVGAAGRQGRRLRVGQDAVGRDPQDQRRVLRDDRPGRQHRSRERVDRQGRPQPLAGQAAARARRGDEPGRPPARRRRRQDLGRPASGVAVGPCRPRATRRATARRRTSSSCSGDRSNAAGAR